MPSRTPFASLRPLLSCALLASLLTGCYQLQTPDMRVYDEYMYKPAAVAPAPAAPGMKVTFLGTSSLLFDDGETRILIDGFVTRPGNLMQLLFGEIGSDRALVRQALERLGVDRIDAIPVFHSHYDHAMDSPEIARLTGATMLGSLSTAMIGRGWGLPERQLQVVEPGKPYTYGKFTLRFYESKHVPLPGIIESTGMMGEIDKPLYQPASLYSYAEGVTWAIVIEHPLGNSMLHSGAMNPAEPQSLAGVKIDSLFVCTPGLPKLSAAEQEAFYQTLIRGTGARRVVPVHWDDFAKPLSEALVPMPRFAEDLDAAMAFLIDRSRREPGFAIQFLPTWEAVKWF